GPIALVREGDLISIDIPAGKLELMVDEKELENRKKSWKCKPSPITTGYLARYARQVTSASTGAIFKQ
ncbi:MAG: dihydroxy-acid dehydratase, partial [Sphaerochaeta sp.]